MTISTFSFADRPWPRWLLAAILAVIGALAWITARHAGIVGETASQADKSTLLAELQSHFDLATQGVDPKWSRMEAVPRAHSAGMDCTPAQLGAKSTTFQIVLPQNPTDRKGTLAVLDPNGSFYTIYISYGIDTDAEDLVIPSRAIEWEMVRTRPDFVVDARSLDALLPDETRSTRLFVHPGVYQFGLLNSHDRELLQVNGDRLRVKAGCVVHWQP